MRIATLADKLYIWDSSKGEESVAYEVPSSYAGLLGATSKHDLDIIFVLRSIESETKEEPNFPGYKLILSKSKNGTVQAWRMWKEGEKGRESRTIKIVLCQRARQWDFHKETDGMSVLRSIMRLHKRGITFELSPGGTGRGEIERRTRKDWLAPADLSGLPEVFAESPSFKRVLTEVEKRLRFFHIVDKSAQYLRACTGVELGVGTPIHIAGTFVSKFFSERQPGLWNVSVDGVEQWLWTPSVHYARRTGKSVTFYAAYLWEKHHTVLRAWAEYIWGTRVAVAGDARAKSINKKLYTQGLGWLRLREERGRDTHDDLNRPDWHELIRDHAFCLIRYKIDSLQAKGHSVVWCNNDEIGFLSDDPNPLTAIPGLVSQNAEMGGFTSKYGGPILLTDVIHAFDEKTSYAEAMRVLYAAGQEVRRGR